MNTFSREMTIRRMQPEDIRDITDIYTYYVQESTATFDLIPPKTEEMTALLQPIMNEHTAWVCSMNGRIVGYAYAHPWKTKKAYSRTLETTLYLHPEFTRKGIGGILLEQLIQDCASKGVHALIACITVPNLPSVKLHQRFGFKKVSHFTEVGQKFGKWLDVADYMLLLNTTV